MRSHRPCSETAGRSSRAGRAARRIERARHDASSIIDVGDAPAGLAGELDTRSDEADVDVPHTRPQPNCGDRVGASRIIFTTARDPGTLGRKGVIDAHQNAKWGLRWGRARSGWKEDVGSRFTVFGALTTT